MYTENSNHFSKMGSLLLPGNKIRISKLHLASVNGPKREDGICLMRGRIKAREGKRSISDPVGN